MSDKEIQEQIDALRRATKKALETPQKTREYLEGLGLKLAPPKRISPPKDLKHNGHLQ